ncbi:NAD-dependent glutamate dehydrogenase [Entomophthora muscae]|uniref:NAD-dependent glutamate dehydrogenase n=3 Tax=Entomophthora muscae TaxID=34485 RepID=A0ACC2SNJ3_9FUNG|nr:NAD-dependent glutamate dehydrogenase [Entomophthora muscae]
MAPASNPATDGYVASEFAGKNEQLDAVCSLLKEQGFIPQNLIETEASWFYGNLGIDDLYFSNEPIELIASHITSLYAAKIQAFTENKKSLDINLVKESESGTVYMHTSTPGVSQIGGPQYEKIIDEKFLNSNSDVYRLESFRSTGTVSSSSSSQLRCYFIAKVVFPNPEPTPEQCRDIKAVSDESFMNRATENTIAIYQRVINNALVRTGPVIEAFGVDGSQEKRLVIGYKRGTTQNFFSALSDLYHYYDLYSTRKYVEQFSNGITIVSLYLNRLADSKQPPIDHTITQVLKEASLIYCLPTTPLQGFFKTNELSVQETIYGYIGWIFAQHFLNRLGSEFSTLLKILDRSNPAHAEVISKIKKRLRQETFTRDYILDIIKSYPELIKLLYVNFAMVHYIVPEENSLRPTLSYQRIRTETVMTEEELLAKIRKDTSNAHECMVLESFLTFNKHVLKTNFYQPTKVAISFRMNPDFLPTIEYSNKLYGMFFIIGSEFRGFHLRFRDVARGGIRVIRSRNREAYSINLRSLFDENYALAATQQRKNKDIPEGGSKGTILLDNDKQDKASVAFEKYVDAILDLLIIGQSPGIKEKIVDLHGKPEILFFGPDEGTADFMDWASSHARERGASFWKAFTTGKSQALGGIPHDLFGMTTRSVHQYVLGIYKKLGLSESECTKLQTGGPDGDLGSNEIKISRDKTIGIVDGSGVLYDPHGIDRPELLRLANGRLMISAFDVSKLSADGYRVLVDERDVRLPTGEMVPDGLAFRNSYHLNPQAAALVFVPCGGRPESVDIDNVHRLLEEDGTPRFKYIVEGANLFFTQDARQRLEKAGAIIFKDASANKGGVTSSSLEVLAALAFNDAEFAQHMQVRDGVVPPSMPSTSSRCMPSSSAMLPWSLNACGGSQPAAMSPGQSSAMT